MKKVNASMLFRWIIFFPLILPLGIISGAMDGIKNTIQQAYDDILEREII